MINQPASKLNDFYNAPDELANLVIIPSGFAMGKPPAEHFNETEQLNRLKNHHISITLPYDNNIYHGNFSNVSWGEALTHSPQERAEMIYEAVSAKNSDNCYKYNNIYFTGGSNTEDVIFELEKFCRQKGPLPQRKDNLNTYGFSDATQLHHYLGQRGISTPVYYSKNIYALISDLSTPNAQTTSLNIQPLNKAALEINELQGYLQPGNQAQVENRPTHQTKFFPHEHNFLVVEFGSSKAAEAFLDTGKKFANEDIVLLLSRDSSQEAVNYLNQNTELPIFTGMPVGHGEALKNGKPVPLFSSALIKKTDHGFMLNCESKASDKVLGLRANPHRPPALIKGGSEQTAVLETINCSAGAVFSNLENLKLGTTSLKINIPYKPKSLVQIMEMSVKALIENKVINPENLESINFQTPPVDENHQAVITKRMKDLSNRYLPQLKQMKLNETPLCITNREKLHSLRGLSPSAPNPHQPQQISKDKLQTLKYLKNLQNSGK